MIDYIDYENKSYYYNEDILIATLDYDSDTFELIDDNDYTKEELDRMYFDMYEDRDARYNVILDIDQFSNSDFR